MRCRLAAVALFSLSWTHAQGIEVASVKLNPKCESVGGRGNITPMRLELPCQSLRTLVWSAYGAFAGGTMSSRRIEVIGGPGWIDSERYDIAVKADGEAPVAQMVGAILRKVLEERFQLKVHTEARDSPVYELTVAKGAHRMQTATEGSCTPMDLDEMSRTGRLAEAPSSGLKYCGTTSRKLDGARWIVDAFGVTMPELAGRVVVGDLDRPVIDRTGLTGRFDLHLEYARGSVMSGPVRINGVEVAAAPTSADDAAGPSIFAALELLGLKLSAAKGPVDVIVIDRAVRPSAN